MSFTPINNDFMQFAKDAAGTSASGFFLKLYAAGTNTPISTALDSAGSILVAKVELDSLGFAKNGSGGATTLYIDQSYRLVLYVNATDADANTFANSVQDIDDIPQIATIINQATVRRFQYISDLLADDTSPNSVETDYFDNSEINGSGSKWIKDGITGTPSTTSNSRVFNANGDGYISDSLLSFESVADMLLTQLFIGQKASTGTTDWNVVTTSGVALPAGLFALPLNGVYFTDFNPLGGGSADDTAFSAAVTVVQDLNTVLILPDSVFVVDNPIAITSRIKIRGENSTKITFNGTSCFDVCKTAPYASYVAIEQITFESTADGIAIDVCAGVVDTADGFIQKLDLNGNDFQSCNIGMRVANSRNVSILRNTSVRCATALRLDGLCVVVLVEKNDFISIIPTVTGILVTPSTNFTDALSRQGENIQIKTNRVFGYNRAIQVDGLLFGKIKDNDLDACIVNGVFVDLATDLTIQGNWINIQAANPLTSIGIEIINKGSYSPGQNGIYIYKNRIRSSDSTLWTGIHIGAFRQQIFISGNSTIIGMTKSLLVEQQAQFIDVSSNNFANGTATFSGKDSNIGNNFFADLDVSLSGSITFDGGLGAVFTDGILNITIASGATTGSVAFPTTLPTGAALLFHASDIGALSKGTIYLRENAGTIIAETSTAIGSITNIRVRATANRE